MLELKNLSAGYGKGAVLDGVTAKFERGSLVSIVGANGCGKSTLLKAAIGILPMINGEITLDGVGVDTMSGNEIAKKIAYLSQGKSTPDMRVEQMVLHGRFPYLGYPRRYTNADREIAKKAMERVGVSHLANEPLANLSGGMRQTVYIAMALAQSTDYVLLDEPTTYLDISHQLELMRLMRELRNDGKGIVAVMHDLPMAFNFSDMITVMKDGRIAAIDTPQKIAESGYVDDIFGVKISYSKSENKFSYSY